MWTLIRRMWERAGPVGMYGLLAVLLYLAVMASYGPKTTDHQKLLEQADGKLDDIQEELDVSSELLEKISNN